VLTETEISNVRERFFPRVAFGGAGGCWLWMGSRSTRGYGQMSHPRGRGHAPLKAHRASYLLHKGDPGALHVLHRCDTPPCVNPAHLWAGTHKQNHQDRAAKGRIHPESLMNLRPGAPGYHGAGPLSRRERQAA